MLLVRYALQEYGQGRYRLEWTNSLSERLRQLSKGGVDLVLLDLRLPEASGPVCYAWIREAVPEVPVIVLTGDTCDETESSVLASGVEGYLVKHQISGSLLLEVIRGALAANQRRQNAKPMAQKLNVRFRWKFEH